MKNANKYNQLVGFWKPQSLSNGQGGTNTSYQLEFVDYACVITKDETKTVAEGQVLLEGFFEIYLRFRADVTITKSHLLKFKYRHLSIHSIVNVNEADREMKLIASESDNTTEVYHEVNPYENYQ